MKDLTCCDSPSQHNLHEVRHVIEDGRYVPVPCWNRICSRCQTHWYGHPDRLVKYTKQEWDALMNTAFDDEPARLEWQ